MNEAATKEPDIRQVITPAEITAIVSRLAANINRDYKGKRPIMVGVLKGSFVFMADLMRKIKPPVEVDFVRAASYGCGTESSGTVRITSDIEHQVFGRDVIIVEDIIDTGLTVQYIAGHLLAKGPASLRVCTLLDKPSRRMVDCHVDYVGVTVEDRFLVGYGLDCAERYRNLKGLYELVKPPPVKV
ncbi:MAG: hypoxanthine phosphoribosyltransferase [Nitrospirae bacterium]|nr:hypoxanthine phosphoribosyltransferase [Nitrospirota bacterium]MBI5695413.1 hypoxanthine phosphoribosyltransferase [Nitrospirota bacterium]